LVFLEGLGMENFGAFNGRLVCSRPLVYFMAIDCSNLVDFSRFGLFYQDKSGILDGDQMSLRKKSPKV
jgi:hypothetical protein